MKTTLRAWGALGAMVTLAALAACDRQSVGVSAAPDPSAQVIGVQPAPPTGDPPGTTPVAGNTSELTQKAESTKMPQEGDGHAYSSLAPNAAQKADGVDPAQAAPERKPQ